MKKVLCYPYLLFSILFITSCSNSDDSASNNNVAKNKWYYEVTLHGETIRNEYEEGNTFSYGAINCDSNIDLRSQNTGQIQKANYFLNLEFVHKEIQEQFEGYLIDNTNVRDHFKYDGSLCYSNFDLITSYRDEISEKDLDFNSTSNNYNKILDVSVYSENQTEITYAVKGKFEVTFKKSDNSLVPVSGNYKTFIYVLK